MDPKQNVCNLLLQSSTDIDASNRRNAELQLRNFANDNGFGALLAGILSDISLNVSIRQLAGLTLKEFVLKNNWTIDNETAGEYNIISDMEKEQIKQMLPNSLGDKSSKIQTAASVCIAKIAEIEWPERWPQLMKTLIGMMSCEDPSLVQGSLICLDVFIDEITGEQVLELAPTLIPILFNVYRGSSSYKIRSLEIMSSILNSLGMISGVQRDRCFETLAPSVGQWFGAVDSLLSEVPMSKLHYGLQTNALSVIYAYIRFFPKLLISNSSAISAMLLKALKGLYPQYCTVILDGNDNFIDTDTIDLDVSGYSFEAEIVQLFETIRLLVISSKKAFRAAMNPLLNEFSYLIVGYMQMTQEQMETWEMDPQQYVLAEDDEGNLENVRSCGEDLLSEIAKSFKKGGGPKSIYAGCSMRLEEATVAGEGSVQYWKLREASFLALGPISIQLVQLYLLDTKDGKPPSFNLIGFLEMLHGILVSNTSSVYLKGRALWCASKFINANGVPVESSLPFFSVSMLALGDNMPLPIRITACRALYMLLSTLKVEHVINALPDVISGIINLIPVASDEIAHIVLETLDRALDMSKEVTIRMEPTVTPILLNFWQSRLNDPLVLGDVLDLFESFAKLPETHSSLLGSLLPVIVSVISNPNGHESGIVETMVDLLQLLVVNMKAPYSPVLFNGVLPLLFRLVSHTDDHSVLQSGATVLRSYVQVAPNDVATWSDGNGNGLQQILSVIGKLLNSDLPDSAVLYAGPLVSSVVQRYVSILEPSTLGIMLEAVLRRMYTSEQQTLKNELLFVFTRLYNIHGMAVIDIVSNIVLDAAKNVKGLDYLLKSWVECHDQYILAYPRKVSIVALGTLLATRNPYLNTLTVQGDEIPDPSITGIRTRSKSKMIRYENVILPVRIFTLLVRELEKVKSDRQRDTEEVVLDVSGAWDDEEDSYDVDDGIYDDVDGEDAGGNMMAYPSGEMFDYMHGGQYFDDDDDEDDDTDAKEDPLYHEDLELKLKEYFKSLSSTDGELFGALTSGMNTNDQSLLFTLMKDEAGNK